MRLFGRSTLALAALASTALVAPSFAGSPYYVHPSLPRAPATADVADVTNPGMVYAQPNGAGPYSCQLGETRTRLQRRACGPLKNQYGD